MMCDIKNGLSLIENSLVIWEKIYNAEFNALEFEEVKIILKKLLTLTLRDTVYYNYGR